MSPQLARTGEWFLRSGIQESNGGVARYYRTDVRRNLPVSTEITGYAASAFVYLLLSMVAGFLLVESGLWLGGRLMRFHIE